MQSSLQFIPDFKRLVHRSMYTLAQDLHVADKFKASRESRRSMMLLHASAMSSLHWAFQLKVWVVDMMAAQFCSEKKNEQMMKSIKGTCIIPYRCARNLEFLDSLLRLLRSLITFCERSYSRILIKEGEYINFTCCAESNASYHFFLWHALMEITVQNYSNTSRYKKDYRRIPCQSWLIIC